KDEGSMVRFLMRQATSDMKVTTGKSKIVIEGQQLVRNLERMVEFKRYCEKATRRLRGDSHLLDTLLVAFGGKKGVLRDEGATLRRTFQNENSMAIVEGVLDKAGYKTELTEDEEHGLWEIKTTTIAGNAIAVDYNFASYVEFQKAV